MYNVNIEQTFLKEETQERSPTRRVRVVKVSVLAVVIVFAEDFFTISPIKQFICHSQRDNVIEFRALRIGAKVQNFATI